MRDYRDFAADLVKKLRQAGADTCDVYIVTSDRFNTTVRLGAVERLQQSSSKGLGLRVFKGGAMALTYTTDFQDATVMDLVQQSMEIVKVSSPDPHNGLAPQDALGTYNGPLNLFDPTLSQLSPEQKLAKVHQMEQAGRDYDPRITNSNGASWNDSISQVTLANSDGFVGQYRNTLASLSVALLAEMDGVKQRDQWYSTNRFLDGLESPAAIGREAGRRVVARLGGRKVPSAKVPVVLSPEVARTMVGLIFSAASGSSIYRRESFLVDKLGQSVAAGNLTIVDDATLENGLGSRPFDGEGVRSGRVELLKDGVLQTYVCDAYSARRLAASVTGNAGRSYAASPGVSPSNLFIENGTLDPQAILERVEDGLYLTEMFGSGINSVTGDFSQGASGFWIRNGKIDFPVQEITIAGNVLQVLRQVPAVGNDLSFKLGSTASPTLLVESMTVGGV